jgi:hypothetical protein
MERKSRTTLWIVVTVVAVVAVIGCCTLAVGAVTVRTIARTNGFGGVSLQPFFEDLSGPEVTERIEQTFEVGSAPTLEIDSIAGATIIRPGSDGTIQVRATKRATGQRNLDAIVVELTQEGDRVQIRTRHPVPQSSGNQRVDLEITVPASTDLDLKLGAGSVEVRDLLGAQHIEAGAGGITIRGAAGPVSATAVAGGIDYEGRPAGTCRFEAGVGGIVLRLPADANVTVDLSAGLGGVMTALPVRGTVTRRSVRGTIGTGDQASLTATAGFGGVDLLRK